MATTTFSQLPGDLTLELVRGDELNFTAVFTGLDLTTYTVTSAVYTAVGNTLTTVATPTVAVTTTTTGGVTTSTVAISLTETQTNAISSLGTTRWYLQWATPGGVTRTILSGYVKAQNP